MKDMKVTLPSKTKTSKSKESPQCIYDAEKTFKEAGTWKNFVCQAVGKKLSELSPNKETCSEKRCLTTYSMHRNADHKIGKPVWFADDFHNLCHLQEVYGGHPTPLAVSAANRAEGRAYIPDRYTKFEKAYAKPIVKARREQWQEHYQECIHALFELLSIDGDGDPAHMTIFYRLLWDDFQDANSSEQEDLFWAVHQNEEAAAREWDWTVTTDASLKVLIESAGTDYYPSDPGPVQQRHIDRRSREITRRWSSPMFFRYACKVIEHAAVATNLGFIPIRVDRFVDELSQLGDNLYACDVDYRHEHLKWPGSTFTERVTLEDAMCIEKERDEWFNISDSVKYYWETDSAMRKKGILPAPTAHFEQQAASMFVHQNFVLPCATLLGLERILMAWLNWMYPDYSVEPMPPPLYCDWDKSLPNDALMAEYICKRVQKMTDEEIEQYCPRIPYMGMGLIQWTGNGHGKTGDAKATS